VVVLAILVAARAGTTPAASPSRSVLQWTPIADLSPFADGSVEAATGFGSGRAAARTVPNGKTVRAAASTSTDGVGKTEAGRLVGALGTP
jgi:hypothetical protein